MASRRRNKRKKLATEPESPAVKPPIETQPTKPQTGTIDLVHQLVEKQLDPDGYKAVTVQNVAEIRGKGRFYVFKKDEAAALAKQEQYLWGPNIEVSLDIKVDEVIAGDEKKFVNIGGPTNHFAEVEGNSNGRNYSLVLRFDRPGIGWKKETIHGCYDEYDANDFEPQLGQWYRVVYGQTVIKNGVELYGSINGQDVAPIIDGGSMTKDDCAAPIVGKDNALYSPIKSARQPWTAGAYSGLYIRLSGTTKTLIKNVSVKEI